MRCQFVIFLLLSAAANGALAAAHHERNSLDQTEDALRAFSGSGTDWPARGGYYSERGYSPLTQINDGNVEKLGLAWVSDVESTRGLEATPIMVGGALYITSTWSRVMAFDAIT